jgi:hypothetical protein
VLGLRITGGFLAGIELEFADGLNCLIGGRGTGKTAALEFLRFGLGLMLRPRSARNAIARSRTRESEPDRRPPVDRAPHQDRHELHRPARFVRSAQVINEAGTPVPVALDRDQIFSADVFSQNEIEQIASIRLTSSPSSIVSSTTRQPRSRASSSCSTVGSQGAGRRQLSCYTPRHG